METKEFHMTVHLNNGHQLVVAFPKQAGGEAVFRLFEEALERGVIAIQIEDRGIAFPMCSVACIELSPALGLSFPYLIEEARLVSSTLLTGKAESALAP